MPEIEKTLRHISPDMLRMEQYMDFLRNRMFRQTLLCHDHLRLDHVSAARGGAENVDRVASQTGFAPARSAIDCARAICCG